MWGANKAKQEDTPGPGNFGGTYSSFNKGKAMKFGAKYKQRADSTPGPGSYQATETKNNVAGAKIGSQARKDPFGSKTAADQPGPGGYMNDTSTFKTKGLAPFGGKYKSQTSFTPGPGEYDTSNANMKSS